MNNGFVNRIKIILEHYDLGVSAFADKIGIQRSSMSHILNGRNKPSLDFVMKLVKTFPEVNLYWLLNGKGSFPEDDDSTSALPSVTEAEGISNKNASKKIEELSNTNSNKEISKIVLFYNDGTFETFNQKKQ
ncbi:helix-turn-helix transcriptional regulator [Flagellimonas meridianipacifica]|uniref:Helix-turn-helix protein n=1 Tax=Flagellimonas meridianipacifica TaxID=1080225 RepID=A0A2T0MC76_9FLAO|nr:helix-turn-helix transcriptional regulator [Allomuricauda pacifica]PRX55075.1 helix-turn-helix protein [Allomuricauda pacifica]